MAERAVSPRPAVEPPAPPRPAPPRPAAQRAVSPRPAAETSARGPVDLRRAFRRHAAGVTIVTMAGPLGPVGFTATSVASLSEEPPLVSLALSTRSSLASVLTGASTLVVHLLSAGHHDLAARFARPGADRFAPPTHWRRLPGGEPLLLDAEVWMRCRIRRRTVEGDHHLVIAEILESRVGRADPPLIYHDGSYGTVGPRSGSGSGPGPSSGAARQAAPPGDGDLGIR